MPTTRSQGRIEPLEQLETPPKRQCKQRAQRPRITLQNPQYPPFRTLSLSPEQENAPEKSQTAHFLTSQVSIESTFPSISVRYRNASTQTEEVVILTKSQAAESRDHAASSMSHKRNRDEESDGEPAAKRHQFSTPQNKTSNTLWMFGEKANGDYPRTAPSKALGASSFRRPVRGPLARRINLAETPRQRHRIPAPAAEAARFDSIKPIDQEMQKEDTDAPTQETNEEESVSEPQSRAGQSTQNAAETPRRGLFGSLRGMVHKSWDFAASLTPLGSRVQPGATSQSSSVHRASPESDSINYPQFQNHAEDNVGPLMTNSYATNAYLQPQSYSDRRTSPPQEYPEQNSEYDHLHYISATTDSISKAIAGEMAPPSSPPTPPSPGSRMKAQNPQLSDATIQSILRKRERKAALDEQRYGPQPQPESKQVAPLFGPDSHYSRGTVDPRFVPSTPQFGSARKRKMEFDDDYTPRQRSTGVGLDGEDLDEESQGEAENQRTTTDEPNIETPPAKRQKASGVSQVTSTMPATPRSAMKKPGIAHSVGRKHVAFGSSVSRDIHGHYGPAGQYKGSTFADEVSDDSRSLSSIDHSDILSPSTRLNTVANSGMKPASVLENIGAKIPQIDYTLRDPNDPKWRPSLANPRPGAFRVPDIDEEDPDETMFDDDTPEQPSTPRISHAELPAPPSTGMKSFNESSIVGESTELALDKARLRAEKYKPKSSSRLSEVSRARSRSTSPDGLEDEMQQTSPPMDATTAVTASTSTAPAVRPMGAPPQPFTPKVLDNIAEGSDGMTDHEREHQYDDWAASLDWDKPQTYEDAGTGPAFIHNLIRKHWTQEDSVRSEAFWAREFDEVDQAMKKAQAHGQVLHLLTGMEEIEGY